MVKSVTLAHLQRHFDDGQKAAEVHAGRKCLIWSDQWHQWWGPDCSGYTPHRPGEAPPHSTEAGTYDFAEAIRATWGCGSEKKIKFVFIVDRRETLHRVAPNFTKDLTRRIERALEYCEQHTEQMWAATIVGLLLNVDFRDAKRELEIYRAQRRSDG